MTLYASQSMEEHATSERGNVGDQSISAELYLFHQGGWDNGQLLYSAYSDASQSWGSNTQLPNVGISASPSAVVWNGNLCVFHQGGYDNGISNGLPNGELWYSASLAGSGWQPDTQVQNVGMSESPSAVVYGADLYVFHQGGYQNGELWYSAYPNGEEWQPDTQLPNVGMSASPSAVVYGNKLYVFHQGGYQNGQLFYSVYDGTNWQPDTQVQNVGMSNSPAAVAYEGNLYVFHMGGYQDGQLFYSVFDGTNWQPDTQVDTQFVEGGPDAIPPGWITGSPAAVVWNNDLFVFYAYHDVNLVTQVGGEDTYSGVGFSSFDGTNWSNNNNVPSLGGFVDNEGPSLVVTSPGGTPPGGTVPGTTFSAPSVALVGNNTVIAAQGAGGSLEFFWQPIGSEQWNPEQVAAPGTITSAPSVAQVGNNTVIAAQGAGGSLLFYWQPIGSEQWNPEQPAGPGTTG